VLLVDHSVVVNVVLSVHVGCR